MKPLTEWTTDELSECLLWSLTEFDAALYFELIRRERERCAAECDSVATAAARECAIRIRRLS